MANLLTYKQMEFLATKIQIKFVTIDGRIEKPHDSSRALYDDGTQRPVPKDNSAYWQVYSGVFYPDGTGNAIVSYVYYNSYYEAMYSYEYVEVIPKDLIAACKKYFGGTPLYVGTKRVNQAICEVGGVLKTVQNIYIKKDGAVKKIM